MLLLIVINRKKEALKNLLNNLNLISYSDILSDNSFRSRSSSEDNNKSPYISNNILGANNNITSGNSNVSTSNNNNNNYTNSNNVTYVKTITYNCLYGTISKYTLEDLLYELKKKDIEYDEKDPEKFKNRLRCVIRANQNRELNYNIITMLGNKVVNEDHLKPYGYYKVNDENIYDLLHYIKSNRTTFMSREHIQKLEEDKKDLNRVYEIF